MLRQTYKAQSEHARRSFQTEFDLGVGTVLCTSPFILASLLSFQLASCIPALLGTPAVRHRIRKASTAPPTFVTPLATRHLGMQNSNFGGRYLRNNEPRERQCSISLGVLRCRLLICVCECEGAGLDPESIASWL
jgi:hypothetical protein